MNKSAVVNIWECKVSGSHCSLETDVFGLMISTCRLSYNGDLDELLQKREAVNA